MKSKHYPKTIESGTWKAGHCQGIAVDTEKGVIYYSFTTILVKTDMGGNFIGSVTGLCGHLGCIAFNRDDGMVYGSLEYKNDAIGRGILKMLDSDQKIPDRLYIAIFDADRITEAGMDAREIMRCACLREVCEDYAAKVTREDGTVLDHRYGCSGIDGTAIGPMFGEDRDGSGDSKKYLFVSYGVYGDITRTDNDYQVILQYGLDALKRNSAPLDQCAMHDTGSEHCGKYFVFTGNTVYGVQNLEYDAYTHKYYMAVYRGKKPQFANPPMFAIDASVQPEREVLAGVYPETAADVLTLDARGTDGYDFERGQTGMASLGDGYFYFSHEGHSDAGQFSTVKLYRCDHGNFVLAE